MKTQGKCVSGSGNSMCKGPGVGISLVCSRDGKKAKWLELDGPGAGDRMRQGQGQILKGLKG